MSLHRPLFAVLSLCLSAALTSVRAEEQPVLGPDRFAELFRPFRTERAALSPDGRYLAYSIREADQLFVAVVEIDHPEKMTARVLVATDESATPPMQRRQSEKTPAQIRWLGWATDRQVIVETNTVTPVSGGNGWAGAAGQILAFDADGANARILVTPKDLQDQLAVPPPAPDPALFAEEAPTANADESDGPEAATQESDTVFRAQIFGVFDYDPTHPGQLLISTRGTLSATPFGDSRRSGLRRLDPATGKLSQVEGDLLPGGYAALLDRQGRIRLTLPATLRSSFPHRYLLQSLKTFGRERPLDDVTSPAGVNGFTLSPENFLGHRSIPLGFDEQANLLYYASNVGRDTYGIYRFDLEHNQRDSFEVANPNYDLIPPLEAFEGGSTLVFDRYDRRLAGVRYDGRLRTAAWLKPGWADAQRQLEEAFPGAGVELLEWDREGRRILLQVTSPGDAGAFYVFDRTNGKLFEFARRAPWLDQNHIHETRSFALTMPGGGSLTGLITLPRTPRVKTPPLLLLCPSTPLRRVSSEYRSRIQAFAAMGFAVVQLNGRGAWGFGVKHREALAPGYEQTQVEDLVVATAVLTQTFKLNPRRVALIGEGHGGYVALRALQLHPDLFRCAIGLSPVIDPGDWLAESRWSDLDGAPSAALLKASFGDAAHLKRSALDASAITKPALIFAYPGLEPTTPPPGYGAARRFASALQRTSPDSVFVALEPDYTRGLPRAQSAVYSRMEEFLNAHIYDYGVKVGPMEVKKFEP